MIDAKSFALLKVLDSECSGQGYKIFSIDELRLSLPEEYGFTADGVREALKTLSERDYVSVKYEDEREVCLKPLVKGRLAFENKIDDEVELNRAEKRYFLWSFLGAAAGAATVFIVALFISLLSGAQC